MMTKEECRTGFAGYKIHLDPPIRVNVDHILHDDPRASGAYFHYFETVPVKMHSMRALFPLSQGFPFDSTSVGTRLR